MTVRRVSLVVLSLLTLLLLVPFDVEARRVRPVPFVTLHEWGVWLFDGGRVTVDDLARESPGFVHRANGQVAPVTPVRPQPTHMRPDPIYNQPATARKPVIFFQSRLADHLMPITIQVGFRGGLPWLHFPGGTPTRVGTENGLVFRGSVTYTRPTNLQPVPRDHFWNHLRAASNSYFVDSATGEAESFLFYDGPAEVSRSFDVRSDGVTVTVRATGTEELAFVVRNGRFATVHAAPEASVRLDALRERTRSLGRLVTAELVRRGMTEAAATALVRTWDHELAVETRAHVISFVPRAAYDAALPITVSPAPGTLQRVGVIIERL